MHTVLAVLAVSAAAADEAVAPWWGKLLVGLLLVVIGAGLSWMVHSGRMSFGEYTEWISYVLVVVMLFGIGIMVWGLGIF